MADIANKTESWNGHTLGEVESHIKSRLNTDESIVGFYTCGTAAETAAKVVAASNYVLTDGGSIKIKFTYANSVASPTLNINSTGAKAIVYNGSVASATNTWKAGDVVEFYYDPTYNSNVGAYIGVPTVVATPEEISQLGQEVTLINDTFHTVVKSPLTITFDKNKFYNTNNGEPLNYAGYSRTRKITLSNNVSLKLHIANLAQIGTVTVLTWRYDGTYIGYVQWSSSQTWLDISSNVGYFAIQYAGTSIDSIVVEFFNEQEVNEKGIAPRRIIPTFYGYYNTSTGEFVYNDSWRTIEKYDVLEGDSIKKIDFDASLSFQYFLFFDANDAVCGVADIYELRGRNGECTAPTGSKKFVFAIGGSGAADFLVIEVISGNYQKINKGGIIAWYGTSIPAGYPKVSDKEHYAYPNIIAKKLGATILNYGVPNGVIRHYRANGSALSRSSDLVFTDANNGGINYQSSMLDLIGTQSEPDLFVFDYGVNDMSEDNMQSESPVDYASRSLNTFIGSYGFVLEKLVTAKKKAKIVILTHYSDDGVQSGYYGKNFWKEMNDAIVGLANYWGIKCIDARHLNGWINTKTTEEGSGVENISTFCPDLIHPASASSPESVNWLANNYLPFINEKL